jgi:hypothetical protein
MNREPGRHYSRRFDLPMGDLTGVVAGLDDRYPHPALRRSLMELLDLEARMHLNYRMGMRMGALRLVGPAEMAWRIFVVEGTSGTSPARVVRDFCLELLDLYSLPAMLVSINAC